MIKISKTVEDIIKNDEVALSALENNLLNLTAYAKKIKKKVESHAKKPATGASIVIALSRFGKVLNKREDLMPKFYINDISIKAPLTEFTYEKTIQNVQKLLNHYKVLEFDSSEFFLVTQSTREITIIVEESKEHKITNIFGEGQEKAKLTNLTALWVSFDEKYVNTPNVLYALMRTLALKRINIVELVSTYTEIAFIVAQEDVEESFTVLRKYYLNRS